MKGVKLEFNVCVTETNQFFIVDYALWIKNIIFVFLWIKGAAERALMRFYGKSNIFDCRIVDAVGLLKRH